jgi:hypothetical protein
MAGYHKSTYLVDCLELHRKLLSQTVTARFQIVPVMRYGVYVPPCLLSGHPITAVKSTSTVHTDIILV